ncbi:leucine-rich repeat domain-containing protein [Paenibacillus sp. URB8-2]|uniref:leucine-rich repeat domain-containing protein n=1 Tax=Paenibacillus sp. URB8-2 TaxID=2741301 RepID=UPI0015B8E743|nr:leucine-rich repeat domain-containing protein [Paenibacillus sp. URB8-2]BCG56747.1 hypothetical protein PUR_01720 [Paenibacillus sp. URB8-2]
MKQRIAKVLISLLLLTYVLPLLPAGTATVLPVSVSTVMADVYDDTAQFPDANLRLAVATWLGKSVTDTVYQSDIIAKLPTAGYTFSVNNKGIADLTGIEIFEGTGIQYLDLGRNSINDLSPLANLTSLQQLNVESNQISSLVPVQNMVNLKALNAGSNSISDLSAVSSLTGLTGLDVSNNAIADVASLAGMVNLTSLNLGRNNIADIEPLSVLIDLQTLQLGSNAISDIAPLSGMTKLQTLFLDINNISDLSPMAGLVEITSLNIGSNNVYDLLPLSNLTNLTQLILSANKVENLAPLSGLTQLSNLQASQNLIHDLSPLAGLGNITYLNLQYNPIVDVTPLSDLTKLSSLNLSNTFLNPFSGEGQTAINSIAVSGIKRTSPEVKYGVTSGSSFLQSIEIEVGETLMPHYGFLQSLEGTNWSSSVSWHQTFRDYYASTASTFSSADPAIASVDASGPITGITPGTTQVTARLFGWSSDYTEYTFEVVVKEALAPSPTPEPSSTPTPTPEPSVGPTPTSTVTPTPTPTASPDSLGWIKVTPNSSVIFVGDSLQYKAEAMFTDGTSQDITDVATWSLDNPSIADINKGLLTAKQFGSSGVVATWGGKSGAVGLMVNKLSVTRLTITPANSTVGVGEMVQLKASAQYSNGSTADVTDQAFWWAVNNILTVIDNHGLVTGLSEGTTNIWAAWNGTNGVTSLTVTAGVSPTPSPSEMPKPSATPTPSPTATPEPSITPTPILTPEPTPSVEPTVTSTADPMEPIPTESVECVPSPWATPLTDSTPSPTAPIEDIVLAVPATAMPLPSQEVLSPEPSPSTTTEIVTTLQNTPRWTDVVQTMDAVEHTPKPVKSNNFVHPSPPAATPPTTNKAKVSVKQSITKNARVREVTKHRPEPKEKPSPIPKKGAMGSSKPLMAEHKQEPATEKRKSLGGREKSAIGVVAVIATGILWIILWDRKKKKKGDEENGE